MSLTKYKLGELIEIVDERNDLGIRDFYGINKSKEFMPTVANTTKLDESKYKIVRKNRFVFSGMQTGRDKSIRLVMYTKNKPIIVSPAYTTFEIKENAQVIPLYFFMIFLSEEKDRLGWFLSDSSIRANLDWEVFCDIEINLPPIEIQKKYVAIYEAMLKNQEVYEEGLEDLKLACDGTLDEIKRKYKKEKLESSIIEINNKVKDCKTTRFSNQDIKGISSVDKSFIETKADTTNVNLNNYKIVQEGHFAFNPNTARMGDRIPIALNTGKDEILVSSIYPVFMLDVTKINQFYLALIFSKPSFDRYVRFNSWGSAREIFDFPDMEDFSIPIPPIEIQKSIANIYKVYTERKEINEKLKEQIKSICPILIKGAMEEACREGV